MGFLFAIVETASELRISPRLKMNECPTYERSFQILSISGNCLSVVAPVASVGWWWDGEGGGGGWC